MADPTLEQTVAQERSDKANNSISSKNLITKNKNDQGHNGHN